MHIYLIIKPTIMKHSKLFLFVAVLFIISCQQKASKEETNAVTADTTAKVAETKTESARPVHWGYEGEEGPQGWASLSPVYALCGSGKSQSPINLVTNAAKGSPAWKIDYKTTSLQIGHNEHVEELINNGHTIQVTPQEGSTLGFEGKIYHLKQFHFHTPSEHTLNGKNIPMEMHLVHQSDDKNLAVVGVLIKEGKHNGNFDQLIKYLPNAPGEKKTHDSVNIDIKVHLPADTYAYHYIGSLTTPPCTENVEWLVLRNQLTLSKDQINAFSSRLKKNNRPTQQLNDRKVTMDDISTK